MDFLIGFYETSPNRTSPWSDFCILFYFGRKPHRLGMNQGFEKQMSGIPDSHQNATMIQTQAQMTFMFSRIGVLIFMFCVCFLCFHVSANLLFMCSGFGQLDFHIFTFLQFFFMYFHVSIFLFSRCVSSHEPLEVHRGRSIHFKGSRHLSAAPPHQFSRPFFPLESLPPQVEMWKQACGLDHTQFWDLSKRLVSTRLNSGIMGPPPP